MSSVTKLNSVSQDKHFNDNNKAYYCRSHKSLLHELHSLLRVMWSGKMTTVISPHSMLYTVWNNIPFFRGYSQQDAQEFLSYVLLIYCTYRATLC